jgi:hypothetical protein
VVERAHQWPDNQADKVAQGLAAADHFLIQSAAQVATAATVEQILAAAVVLELTPDQQLAAQVATVATVQQASSS